MLRRMFGGLMSKFGRNQFNDEYSASAKSISSRLAKFVIDMTKFEDMNDEDVYDQLYVWEPAVGSAIDRLSALVRQSFAKLEVVDAEVKEGSLEEKMLEDAEDLEKELEIYDFIESLAELLLIQGNIFILKEDLSYIILPNKHCAWIEKKSELNERVDKVITKPNYLAFNETLDYETKFKPVVYDKDQVVHIKYKNTPQFVTDCVGRKTFNIYSISPLHRTVLSVWWKRQITIIDVLLRWRNVPREHHKINAEMFNLMNYQGASVKERRDEAVKDINEHINRYTNQLQNLTPDASYVTTNNVEVEMVETRNRNVTPTAGNILLDQLDASIMAGLNIPATMISGASSGSYATELIVSNYVSSKVIHISQKLKPVILELLRNRLKKINPAYPVDKLEYHLELYIDTQRINLYREASMMASLGVFTDDEIRTHIPGYEPLTDEQRAHILEQQTIMAEHAKRVSEGSDANYPDTPQSDAQHTRIGENRKKIGDVSSAARTQK